MLGAGGRRLARRRRRRGRARRRRSASQRPAPARGRRRAATAATGVGTRSAASGTAATGVGTRSAATGAAATGGRHAVGRDRAPRRRASARGRRRPAVLGTSTGTRSAATGGAATSNRTPRRRGRRRSAPPPLRSRPTVAASVVAAARAGPQECPHGARSGSHRPLPSWGGVTPPSHRTGRRRAEPGQYRIGAASPHVAAVTSRFARSPTRPRASARSGCAASARSRPGRGSAPCGRRRCPSCP